MCTNDFPTNHMSKKLVITKRSCHISANSTCRFMLLCGVIWMFGPTAYIRAQFAVSDPGLESASAEEVGAKAIEVEEKGLSLSTQLSIDNVMEKTLNTSTTTLDFMIKSYNFQKQTDTAPTSDYSSYQNNGVIIWTPIVSASNTYGNSQQWIDAASTASGSTSAVQAVSITYPGRLSGYDTLAADGQQAIAAVAATIQLEDAATATSLETLGTVRRAVAQREIDIATLETSNHSTSSPEKTLMSELQRTNQAILLRLRGEQEEMELQQAQDTHRLLRNKARLDAIKTALAAATEFERNYASYTTVNVLNLTGSSSH